MLNHDRSNLGLKELMIQGRTNEGGKEGRREGGREGESREGGRERERCWERGKFTY